MLSLYGRAEPATCAIGRDDQSAQALLEVGPDRRPIRQHIFEEVLVRPVERPAEHVRSVGVHVDVDACRHHRDGSPKPVLQRCPSSL